MQSTPTSFWHRLARGMCRLRERSDWTSFAGADWAKHIMATPVTDRFHAKQGRSTGRWILNSSNGRLAVYLKRHYRLSWWRGVLATLFPSPGWSPAWQELRNLDRARESGLPVPETVAAGEFIGPWGRLQSFLAIEELAGMLPLNEAVPAAQSQLDPQSFRTWKRGLVHEVARLARLLHQRHWFHKDLYLCHFYIDEARTASAQTDDWTGNVHLIDLHRLGYHSWLRMVWQVKDLAQLLYSSRVEGVDARDRLRFWKLYLGPERKTPSGRWLRWLVTLKWRRYQRHNDKRRRQAANIESKT